MDWLSATAQVSQIAAITSVIFAAVSIRANTRLSRKQWNIETFITYSKRHKAAADSFPNNAFYSRLDSNKLPPRSPELTQAVRHYFFVICDVHYLFHQKYLDDSIWQVWRNELERTLNCPLITREWPDIKPEFQYFEAFTQFVESMQLSVQKTAQKKES